jgi:hypothetical protein
VEEQVQFWGQFFWNFWWIKCQRDGQCSEHVNCPLSASLHKCSTLIIISILLLSEGQAGEVWEPLIATSVLADIREHGAQIAVQCFVHAVGRLMYLTARMNKRNILGSNRDCTRSWYRTSAKCSQIMSGVPLIMGRQL